MALLLFARMLAFIENVRRAVKILRALSGHHNLVKFYDACEDANNVYIIMELCEDGDLLDRILSRGGKYSEEDAKVIVRRILSIVAFCPNERPNDIVGSTYYVAPEVLHQSYSMAADVWRVGVIACILLCESRPFWERTESRIFHAVLKS